MFMSAFKTFITSQKDKFRDELLADMRYGVYPADKLMPPRRLLAEKYKVSESTVTRLIADLTDQKILATRKGRFGGTFLRQLPNAEQKFSTLHFHSGMALEKAPRCAAFRSWIFRFNRENPNIQVDLRPQKFNFRQMESLEAEFSELYESSLPSLCLVPLTSLPALALHHTIHPFLTDKYEIENELRRFRPEYRSTLLFNNSLYGFLTEGGSSSLMLYSSERLKTAGIKDSAMTVSWKSFISSLKKLNSGKGALCIQNNESGLFLFFMLLLKGRMTKSWIRNIEDWNGVMASPECFAALEDLRMLNDEVGIEIPDRCSELQTLQMLDKDGPAVVFTTNSQAGSFFRLAGNENMLKLFLPPSQKSSRPNTLQNMLVWVLIREPDRETAMKFLRWTAEPENWAFYFRQIQSFGNHVSRSPYADAEPYQRQLGPVHSPWIEINKQIERTPVELEAPGTHDFRSGIAKILLDWLRKGGSVHDGQERLCGFWSAWAGH